MASHASGHCQGMFLGNISKLCDWPPLYHVLVGRYWSLNQIYLIASLPLGQVFLSVFETSMTNLAHVKWYSTRIDILIINLIATNHGHNLWAEPYWRFSSYHIDWVNNHYTRTAKHSLPYTRINLDQHYIYIVADEVIAWQLSLRIHIDWWSRTLFHQMSYRVFSWSRRVGRLSIRMIVLLWKSRRVAEQSDTSWIHISRRRDKTQYSC